MLGKVFEIGYTLRKKMPILISANDYYDKEWASIFYMNDHLFNLTMRGYNLDVRLSSLLIYSHRNLEKQNDKNNLICKAYYPRKQIKNTHKLFIPILDLYPHKISGCIFEKWESNSINKKNIY